MVVKVVKRKLGREGVAGLAHCGEETIEIDPRLRPHGGSKGMLGTHIHETIHILSPEMKEKEVVEWEDTITEVLWKAGYRRTEQ